MIFPPAIQSPAPDAPKPFKSLRAQYAWGYMGADGEGSGTMSILLEPANGNVVIELQGLGERLLLLTGDTALGYRVMIPKQKVDRTAATLAELPLPFLPSFRTVDGLMALLQSGGGVGVTITKKDEKGPVKLHYKGQDERGKEVQVWLTRKKWEPTGLESPASQPPPRP